MSKHTPTPWAHRNGRIFAADRENLTVANIARAFDGDYSPANAEFIVRACNSHDALVRRAIDVLEGLEGMTLTGAMPVRVEKLRAALAAAGVQS